MVSTIEKEALEPLDRILEILSSPSADAITSKGELVEAKETNQNKYQERLDATLGSAQKHTIESLSKLKIIPEGGMVTASIGRCVHGAAEPGYRPGDIDFICPQLTEEFWEGPTGAWQKLCDLYLEGKINLTEGETMEGRTREKFNVAIAGSVEGITQETMGDRAQVINFYHVVEGANGNREEVEVDIHFQHERDEFSFFGMAQALEVKPPLTVNGEKIQVANLHSLQNLYLCKLFLAGDAKQREKRIKALNFLFARNRFSNWTLGPKTEVDKVLLQIAKGTCDTRILRGFGLFLECYDYQENMPMEEALAEYENTRSKIDLVMELFDQWIKSDYDAKQYQAIIDHTIIHGDGDPVLPISGLDLKQIESQKKNAHAQVDDFMWALASKAVRMQQEADAKKGAEVIEFPPYPTSLAA